MRKLYILMIVICASVFLFTSCGFLGIGGGRGFRSDLKFKVAVLPFDNSSQLGEEGLDVSIAEQLSERLGADRRIVIVPWSEVESYVERMKIPLPLTQNTAGMVGRSLGLNAVVLGTVAEISQVQQLTGWRSWLPFIFDRRDYVVAVLAVKVVDVETALTLGAEVSSGETQTGQTLDDLMLGNPSGGLSKEYMEQSLKQAVEKMTDNVLDSLSYAEWKGFLTDVDGNAAVMAAGEDVGIEKGDRFVVYSVGDTITNAAGQTFVIPGPVKAELEAADVGPQETRLKILSGEVFMGEAAYQAP